MESIENPQLLALFLISLLFSTVLLYMWCGLILNIYLGSKSKSWPSTKGKSTFLAIRSQRQRHNRVTYHVTVAYEYEIDGIQYKGSRIKFGTGWESSSNTVQRYQTQYKEGQKVKVYYHPSRQSISTLEVEKYPSFTNYSLAIVFTPFLLMALGAMISLLIKLLKLVQAF